MNNPNPFQGFFDQLDTAIEEADKPLLVELNSNPEKAERIMGVLNHLKDNNETVVCNMGTSAPTNMFGVFLEDGRRAMPNWYKKFVEVCDNNKDKKCLMVFDELDKSPRDAVALFLQEAVFNEHDLYPLPYNAQVVCTVENAEDLKKDGVISESALESFTVVNGAGTKQDISGFIK